MKNNLTLNVRAICPAVSAALRELIDGGSIITIGSIITTSLDAFIDDRDFAWDLGIRPVHTEMNPDLRALADFLCSGIVLKRSGIVEEVASLVSYLAGPDAGFISGATIIIDGGSLA